MKLGKFTIHYLRGGNTNIDGGAMFGVVPKPLWTRKYQVNDKIKFTRLHILYLFKLKIRTY